MDRRNKVSFCLKQTEAYIKYLYYPGCISDASEIEAGLSARLVAEKLKIELVSMDVASCCGAGELGLLDPNLEIKVNARNLAMAEKNNLDIVTICNVCLMTMKNVNLQIRDNADIRQETNEKLKSFGLQCSGRAAVRHLLWAIIEDVGLRQLKALVTNPLRGLKIAPFYGCYILRPSHVMQFEDPQNPSSLSDLIDTLGGTPIGHEGMTKCCGFRHFLIDKKISLKMLGKRLREIKNCGAECIVTPCPLCHLALDTLQKMASRSVKMNINIPVFYFTQLIGIALGINAAALKFNRHFISPAVLKKCKRF